MKQNKLTLSKERELAFRKLCMTDEIKELVAMISEDCDRATITNVNAKTTIKNLYRNQGVYSYAKSILDTLEHFIPGGRK